MCHSPRVVSELGRLLAGAETDGDASSHSQLRDRCPGRRAHLVREGNESARELSVGPGVADLGTEVRVDADEGEALRARDLACLSQGFARADRRAELAVDRPGDEVRVRVHLDAGRDAKPHRLRTAPAMCQPGEPLDTAWTETA